MIKYKYEDGHMPMGKGRLERYQRLHNLAKRIVDGGPSIVDDDTKVKLKTATLKYAATQYIDTTQALENLYHDEGEIGFLLRKAVEVIADHDESERDDARDDRDDGTSDHEIAQLADLLVEAERFSTRAEALNWLLHHPNGHALVRTHKAKDHPMQNLTSIMKASGIAGTCAAIVAKGSTSISEHEFVEAVTKVAADANPEMSEPQAFSKVFTANDEQGRLLRSAINVCKASLAEQMLGPGLPVQVVGGSAARDVNDPSEAEAARDELMRAGRKQYPRLDENAVFERAFTDPRNAAIVARLYHRPLPTSIYPMPREWLRGEGEQHTKADRGSAYNELMEKAEEYRNAHPELSEAQAFAKVYSDPANRDIAKRERIEAAPR